MVASLLFGILLGFSGVESAQTRELVEAISGAGPLVSVAVVGRGEALASLGLWFDSNRTTSDDDEEVTTLDALVLETTELVCSVEVLTVDVNIFCPF